jgi:hypothetical protein
MVKVMDISNWLNEIEGDIEQLKSSGREITEDGNIIYPAPEPNIFNEFISRLNSIGIGIDSQIVSLYKECNGIYLTDVYNGYFIWPLEILLRNLNTLGPTRISAPYNYNILVFGDDGGGEGFALRADGSEEILFLPEGLIENFTYDAEDKVIKVISKNFYGFLIRLQADFRAHLANDPSWVYMTDMSIK